MRDHPALDGPQHIHANVLAPPEDPTEAKGFLIVKPVKTPSTSGSHAIWVVTLCLETGLVPMPEPAMDLLLETSAELVPIKAQCRAGTAARGKITKVLCFADWLGAPLNL